MANEFEGFHMIDQGTKRIPEALDICEQNWLTMTTELDPCYLFNNLFQRSNATGHRYEGIRHLEHFAFSLVHIPCNNEIVRPTHCMLTGYQEFGNDAGHFTAMFMDGFSNATHHSD